MNQPLQSIGWGQDKSRSLAIKKEILDCYTSPFLVGKFRVQLQTDENTILVFIIHPHLKQIPFIQVSFPQKYPQQSINVINFIQNKQNEAISQAYTPNKQINKLKDIIHQIYQKIENDFHQNPEIHLLLNKKSKDSSTTSGKSTEIIHLEEQIKSSSLEIGLTSKRKIKQQKSSTKKTKQKKQKNQDNELTQTKNLNRHYRSKLRQVYKDLMLNEKESEDSLYIQKVFSPNRVGFEDIRKALKNDWFNKAIKKEMSTGRFLNRIMRGMMGVKSKKLMIKYYHVMAMAVDDPESFIRWKYQ